LYRIDIGSLARSVQGSVQKMPALPRCEESGHFAHFGVAASFRTQKLYTRFWRSQLVNWFPEYRLISYRQSQSLASKPPDFFSRSSKARSSSLVSLSNFSASFFAMRWERHGTTSTTAQEENGYAGTEISSLPTWQLLLGAPLLAYPECEPYLSLSPFRVPVL
jgi:hypothetical protein